MSIVAMCSAVTADTRAPPSCVRPSRPRSTAASSSSSTSFDRTPARVPTRGRRVQTRATRRDEDARDASNDLANAREKRSARARRRPRDGGPVTAAFALAVSAAVLVPGCARLDASAFAGESSFGSPLPSVEVPAALDPWKDGRARKAAERRAYAENVDKAFRREAEQRAENERLSAAYYAKAAAIRKARAAAERDGLTGPEVDSIANEAGQRAFESAARAVSDEDRELELYEQRQRKLRETAELRNAEALAAAAEADAEVARLRAAAAELESLRKACVGADSPLVAPGSVVCT